MAPELHDCPPHARLRQCRQSDEDCKQRRARNSPAKREQSRHQHAQNEAAGGRADEGWIGTPNPVLPTAE